MKKLFEKNNNGIYEIAYIFRDKTIKLVKINNLRGFYNNLEIHYPGINRLVEGIEFDSGLAKVSYKKDIHGTSIQPSLQRPESEPERKILLTKYAMEFFPIFELNENLEIHLRDTFYELSDYMKTYSRKTVLI